MERAQALTRLIARFPDMILIKKSPPLRIPFPLGVDQAVGTSSTPELARLPSSRQQQQERIAQRFDALFTKDEDHAAAATQRIEDQAYHDAQEAAAAYDHVQGSLTDVITQTRDLRAQIQSGTVPEKDARELLADLGRQLAKLVGKIARPRAGTTARRPP